LKSCSSCLPFTQLSLMCGPEVRLGDLRPCQVLPPYSCPSPKVPQAPSTGWGCGIPLYLPVRAIRWSYLQALLPLHNLLPSCDAAHPQSHIGLCTPPHLGIPTTFQSVVRTQQRSYEQTQLFIISQKIWISRHGVWEALMAMPKSKTHRYQVLSLQRLIGSSGARAVKSHHDVTLPRY
jgi:hypothetical protein